MSSDEGPSKSDINLVFKKLRAFSANKVCFDCGAKNPTWSSVTYGVFICIDCSAVHRGLGVHLSFVRSTQLDTNWTWLQLRAMQVGGNTHATQFFRQHGCTTTDAQQKYKSRAATLYREKLHHAAVQAMRVHGTRVHLDSQSSPTPGEAEVDFFSEHTADDAPDLRANMSAASLSDQAYIIAHADQEGPTVPENLDSHSAPAEPRKATIGQKKPQPKKAAFGAKKGKMGAQKVKTNFSEIEQQAETLDRKREEATILAVKEDEPEPDVQKLSSRLMVQDISNERQKQEEKVRAADPKKVGQVERLGMGFRGASSGVSHSIANDMTSIKQDGVRTNKSASYKPREPDYNVDDEWEIVREPGKRPYDNDNGRSAADDDFSSAAKNSSNDFFSNWDKETTVKEDRRNGGSRSARAQVGPTSASEEAQKKFGNAKAISSDQFFGNQTTDYETRTNLQRFDGASAISSADFYGTGDTSGAKPAGGGYYSYSQHVPEMADIKDSVRSGVTKVAGRLSSLGSSVSTYISDHYNVQ